MGKRQVRQKATAIQQDKRLDAFTLELVFMDRLGQRMMVTLLWKRQVRQKATANQQDNRLDAFTLELVFMDGLGQSFADDCNWGKRLATDAQPKSFLKVPTSFFMFRQILLLVCNTI